MKLYVCWTTRGHPGGHPCTDAYEALRAAGYDPEVVKARSWGALPDAIQSSGRKAVKAGTGEYWVPALQKDDSSWISGSKEIVAWAEQNPA